MDSKKGQNWRKTWTETKKERETGQDRGKEKLLVRGQVTPKERERPR